MNIYKELAKIPVPTGAEFLSTSRDSDRPNLTTIQAFYSVTDFTKNVKRQMSKYLNVSPPSDGDKSAISTTNLEDMPGIVLQRNSPSKKKRAILRKVANGSVVNNKGAGTSRIVEVWEDGLLEVSLDVTDLHGDFYADEFLGSLEFAPSESSLVYVAELKESDNIGDDDDVQKDPFRKYRFNPDFGEGFTGKSNPTIFLLNWSPSSTVTPPKLFRLSTVRLQNWRFGQPIFDPKDSNVLYATGYELTRDGRALGIKHCFNRPSGIWKFKLVIPPHEPTEEAASQKNAVINVNWAQKLTPSSLSCRSPRVLDTGDRSLLIWLSCACGGAHASTTTLHLFDITSSWGDTLESPNSLISANTPLVGIVGQPLKDISTFPGLYPACNLVSSPFISLGDDSRQHEVLVSSQWGPRTTILRVSLKDGGIQELTPATDGKLHSWSLLATDGGENFVCSRSAPGVPHEILLGQFQKNGEIHWTLLDKPVVHKNVAEALEGIKTRVVSVEGRGLVESIIVQSEFSTKNGIIPPCVTAIHGGPHTASSTAFVPSTTALAVEGYTVSLPNYTGSTGYGEAFLQAVIGRCGELDVADCIATSQHLCKLGISEEGQGKQLIMGGSHGGFLTAHLIGKFPSFFSAAVLRNPVISVGDLSSTDIPDWYFSEFGLQYPLSSTPSEQPSSLPPLMTSEIFTKLSASSPILHVDQISIPVLLLIGKADRRVIPTHGIEFYHALKARKRRVEMLCFDGEGHALDGVEAAKVSFEAAIDLFAQATT